MKHILGIVMSALLAGCFTVEMASSPSLGEDSVAHVTIGNYGWMLFGCVPLLCGNANFDSWCPFVFFRDDIKPEFAYEKLMALAEEKGCRVEDINMLGDNAVLFDAYYAPVPWIIVYKETNLSANLVRRGR